MIQPEPAERLLKIPGRVNRADLAVIIRAVTLYLAHNADLDDDSLEKSGKAIAAICRAYLTTNGVEEYPKKKRKRPSAKADGFPAHPFTRFRVEASGEISVHGVPQNPSCAF